MLSFYVFFTLFALTNIITGIIVDSVIKSAQEDKDEIVQSMLHDRCSHVQQLRQFFESVDVDESGNITFDELKTSLKDPEVRVYLEALGLEMTEAQGMFKLLDQDNSGSVNIEEFIYTCMHLLGSAKAVDLATLMAENKKMAHEVRNISRTIASQGSSALAYHAQTLSMLQESLGKHAEVI